MSRRLGMNEWWAVVNRQGFVMLDTLRWTRSEAIKAFLTVFCPQYNMLYWRSLRTIGDVRCVRVEIVECAKDGRP